MYFSDHFGIKRTKRDDWFDPILDADTKLFVDPFLIFQDADPRWRSAHDRLIDHFNICFKLIAEGRLDPKTLPYRKALALLRFPEPREFCLGYTETGTRGAGGGAGFARLIAEAMEDAIERGLVDLKHFEELGVLNEGIGPDRISDLTCNVLRSEFIQHTIAVAKKHKVPTEIFRVGGARYDATRKAWRSVDVELPKNPAHGGPILLVPERFLRDLPVLNADDWWESYEAEQLRTDVNYEVMGKVKKKTIVSIARRRLQSVREWTRRKEDTAAEPYDLVADPLGVWGWSREAELYAKSQPIVIQPPADETAFIAVIELVIARFRHFIEQSGGWKLLWNDGHTKEKPEEAAQLLFKGIAQSYCATNDIVVDREVELGRGSVDFKFSNGYRRRAHLEVKKLHNGKFWRNLEMQLPTYLKADECDLGWFVTVRYKDGGASKRWLTDGPALVREIGIANGLRLTPTTVDARPKKPASKL